MDSQISLYRPSSKYGSGHNADGLAVKLGFTGVGNTNNSFITFLNGLGNIQGKSDPQCQRSELPDFWIDFAEYFTKASGTNFTTGDVVVESENGATTTNMPYDSDHRSCSEHPGFTGGTRTG